MDASNISNFIENQVNLKISRMRFSVLCKRSQKWIQKIFDGSLQKFFRRISKKDDRKMAIVLRCAHVVEKIHQPLTV